MTCFFRQLDDRATEYVRSILEYANPLGRVFLATARLEHGRVYALLPSGRIGDPYKFKESIVQAHDAPKLESGSGSIQAVSATDYHARIWVESIFRDDPGIALVAESFALRARFKRPRDPGRVLTQNDFIYYVAVPGDEAPLLEACIGCVAAVPPGCGFLWTTGQSASSWLDSGVTMTDELQQSIVRNVRALMIGSYDGDSLVVWVPPKGIAIPQFVAEDTERPNKQK